MKWTYLNGRSRYRKVKKHKETYGISYRRDVSGIFMFNIGKENIKGKSYIKLILNEEINFADEISYQDYMIQKINFWKVNEKRDVEFAFKESRIITNKKRFYF